MRPSILISHGGMAHFKILLFVAVYLFTETSLKAQKWNGVSLVPEKQLIKTDQVKAISKSEANTVVCIPHAFTTSGIPSLEWNQSWQWKSETLEGITHTVSLLKTAGYKVVIKPHVLIEGGGNADDLQMHSPDAWQLWWDDYSGYILSYAKLADSVGADMFVIGNNLSSTLIILPDQWLSLIDRVREVYDGPLTYADTWDQFENNPLWSRLDYIGINAYFPCDSSITTDPLIFEACLNEAGKRIEKLSSALDKKVIFTEFGFRSINRAGWKQDEFPLIEQGYYLHVNQLAQVNAFRGFFKAFWNKPWLVGGFLWKWEPNVPDFIAKGNGYTIQGKPALEVVKAWYAQFGKKPITIK